MLGSGGLLLVEGRPLPFCEVLGKSLSLGDSILWKRRTLQAGVAKWLNIDV